MKYGKKESGHERKSPEGLAMLRLRRVANTLQRDEQTKTNLTLTNGSALIAPPPPAG